MKKVMLDQLLQENKIGYSGNGSGSAGNIERERSTVQNSIGLKDLANINQAKNRWKNVLYKKELLKKDDGFEDYIQENQALLMRAEEQLQRVRML